MLQALRVWVPILMMSACGGEEPWSAPEAEPPSASLDARVAQEARLDARATEQHDAASKVDAALGARAHELDAGAWPANDSLCAELSARAGVTAPQEGSISWAALLCETVDLERLTRLPTMPYQARMASSYNRASVREDEPGWFANEDFSHFLRHEGDEHVMMEASGPGVITRLWTPNPSGRLRIYIDDPTTPAIDVPMAELFSEGLQAPWSAPFVFEAAEGHNSYFPIPYASYVRVSTTSNEPFYYQVDHRAYAAGARVEPFSRAGLQALAPLAQQLASIVADPARDPRAQGLLTQTLALTPDAPEQQAELGPAMVRELVVRGFPTAGDGLRTTRLVITIDGEPAIDAPLGDLFGAGPGLLPFQSLAASVSADTLTLRWPLPVAHSFRARVESSESSAALPAQLQVALRYARLPEAPPLRFHARWSGVQSIGSRSPRDWTVLHYRGTGWYVGTALNVGNPSNLWWGEGDEKIFVDGESFPSHFGTGTEDYFGQGWCSTELVARPWLGQTRADGPANAGRTSVYRWHVADAVPFGSELRFRLEVLTWLNQLADVPITQDAVTYWYGMPGGHDEAATLTRDAFVVPPLKPVTVPALPGTSTCKI